MSQHILLGIIFFAFCLFSFSKASEVKINEGDTHVLRCGSVRRGDLGLVEVYWKRDGVRLGKTSFPRIFISASYSLVIRDAKLHDSGIYACVTVGSNPKETHLTLLVLRKLKLSLSEQCGQASESYPPDRIPWMAMLYCKRTNQPICGASLVSKQWVLTAAHCYDEYINIIHHNFKDEVIVKLGSNDWYGQQHSISGVHRFVSAGGVGNYDRDLLLLKLAAPVTYDHKVRPICLPTRKVTKGEIGLMTGWGAPGLNGLPSRNIKKHLIPVQSRGRCRSTILSRIQFTENMFCAGRGNGMLDQCAGDSGGPFAVKRANKWYLAGVVSFGESCDGSVGKYGYYVEVNRCLSWIRKTILSNNYNEDFSNYDYVSN